MQANVLKNSSTEHLIQMVMFNISIWSAEMLNNCSSRSYHNLVATKITLGYYGTVGEINCSLLFDCQIVTVLVQSDCSIWSILLKLFIPSLFSSIVYTVAMMKVCIYIA